MTFIFRVWMHLSSSSSHLGSRDPAGWSPQTRCAAAGRTEPSDKPTASGADRPRCQAPLSRYPRRLTSPSCCLAMRWRTCGGRWGEAGGPSGSRSP